MLALDVACFLVDHPQERGWVRRGKRLERSDVESVDRACQGSTNKMERASSKGSEQAPVAISEKRYLKERRTYSGVETRRCRRPPSSSASSD